MCGKSKEIPQREKRARAPVLASTGAGEQSERGDGITVFCVLSGVFGLADLR